MIGVVAGLLVALFVFAALGSVFLIGRPRAPITPGHAVTVIITDVLLIAATFYLALN